MDFDLGEDAAALRTRIRGLIAQHLPADFLGAFTDDPEDLELTRRFSKVLAGEGLLALAWPVEFGGGGASVWEQAVLREEMWAHYEPRGPQYMGLNWVGPAIMRFGTPAQQDLHLKAIAGGEALWCQGFSEPDAGSDLASLRTVARRVDGGWRVTGQKIWTSYAQVADWCFLAARTSTTEKGRRGISIFLLPMDRTGIEVRPIDNLLGPYHLNEVFFDDVCVHDDELLGTEHAGWDVIREALAFERVGIARYARGDRLLGWVRQAVGGIGAMEGPLQARFASALVHNRVARLLAYEVIGHQDDGTATDSDAAAARIAAVLNDQEVSDVLVDAIGPSVFDSEPESGTNLHAVVEDYWRYSRAATVAAGSVDIQRSIVARGALRS